MGYKMPLTKNFLQLIKNILLSIDFLKKNFKFALYLNSKPQTRNSKL
jgi:hypothetical protein